MAKLLGGTFRVALATVIGRNGIEHSRLEASAPTLLLRIPPFLVRPTAFKLQRRKGALPLPP
eukprot:8080791-Prorocentrum_lima.AAC.1